MKIYFKWKYFGVNFPIVQNMRKESVGGWHAACVGKIQNIHSKTMTVVWSGFIYKNTKRIHLFVFEIYVINILWEKLNGCVCDNNVKIEYWRISIKWITFPFNSQPNNSCCWFNDKFQYIDNLLTDKLLKLDISLVWTRINIYDDVSIIWLKDLKKNITYIQISLRKKWLLNYY